MNFKNLLSFFSSSSFWLKTYLINSRKNQKFIKKYQLNTKIDIVAFDRIENYLSNISLIGYSLLQELHTFSFSALDYERLNWLAVTTPLIDDLMDKNNHAFTLTGFDKNENKLLDEAINQLQRKNTYYHNWEDAIQNLLSAQNASLIQRSDKIAYETLKKVTFAKGAASMTLLRHMIDLEYAPNEQILIQQLGLLIQFMDDLTDVYFDREEKTFTIATNCKNSQLLHNEYIKEWNILKTMVQNSIFPLNKKNNFINNAALFFARGLVSIYQIEKTMEKYQDDWINQATREELVVDMGKWKNKKLLYVAWKELMEAS